MIIKVLMILLIFLTINFDLVPASVLVTPNYGQKYKQLGLYCISNYQCKLEHSICSINQCRCEPQFVEDASGERCRRCYHNSECRSSRICQYGRCVCPSGVEPEGDQIWCPDWADESKRNDGLAWWMITLIVLVGVAAIGVPIVCFLVENKLASRRLANSVYLVKT